MKWNAAHQVSAVVVLALAATVAGQVHADCGPGQRTSHEDADCLSATWDTSFVGFNLLSVKTRNLCPDIGTVVARINIFPEPGGTNNYHFLTLEDGTTVVTHTAGQMDGVYCCEDKGDEICNRSDVTAESCLDRFGDSPASATCSNSSATVNASYECGILADCGAGESSSVVVRYGDVDDLRNCSGHLQVGGCDGSESPLLGGGG